MIRDGDIASPRLRLRPLDEAVLDFLIAGRITEAEQGLGAAIPLAWASSHLELFALRRDDLAAPAYRPWGLRALVLQDTNAVIGHAGFHAAPATSNGQVELGYAVEPAHRRLGLATEALNALMSFATEQGVTHFALSIRPGNTPSIALAKRAGYVRHGQHTDETDGLEEVWLKTTR